MTHSDISQSNDPNEHNPELLDLFDDIKKTLNINHVPSMFMFLEKYPVFLKRLWDSIKVNVEDPAFNSIIQRISFHLIQSTKLLDIQPSAVETTQLMTHKIFPSSEQKNLALENIHDFLNQQVRMALIAIAIRESTKGWSLGAKKLEQQTGSSETFKTVFDKDAYQKEVNEIMLRDSQNALTQRPDVQNQLTLFAMFIQREFKEKVRNQQYVFSRVQAEQIFVDALDTIPHPLFASYNQVVKSVPSEKDILGLFYLLADKFPVVHAVSALMWSYGEHVLEDYEKYPMHFQSEQAPAKDVEMSENPKQLPTSNHLLED